MRIFSHNRIYLEIFKFVLTIVIAFLFSITNKAYAFTNNENMQKIFSLGRSVGSSYFHLTDLSDKAKSQPYLALKNEYNAAFQSLNIMEIILDDLGINSNTQALLEKLRQDFYNSLKSQDLNEISVMCIRDAYIFYYETLAKDIQQKFSAEGSWLFSLGFYSSFQLESLKSPSSSKLLLSGFNKILITNPFTNLPESVLASLKAINSLDKKYITDKEIGILKQNIIQITGFFQGYTDNKTLAKEVKDFVGIWNGTLIDPENKRHKMRLVVNNNTDIKMDIDGIARDILISDVKLINNYFTFLFKPFGNEKLYIKFNAKISNNTFSGEVVDVLGQKGNWLLSRNNS